MTAELSTRNQQDPVLNDWLKAINSYQNGKSLPFPNWARVRIRSLSRSGTIYNSSESVPISSLRNQPTWL